MRKLVTGDFKTVYRKEIDELFKRKFTEYGMYGMCELNGKYGVLTLERKWSPYNTINTNNPLALYIVERIESIKPNSFPHLYNYFYTRSNVEKIIKYIEENFEDIFINDDENNELYKDVLAILSHSWISGVVSTIIAINGSYDCFKDNMSDVIYNFGKGDLEDFKGTDITTKLIDGTKNTHQVKGGRVVHKTSEFTYLTCGINDFKYKTDYYIFTSVKEDYNGRITPTSCVIFENRPTINKIGEQVEIESNSIIYHKTFEELQLPETLNEVNEMCFKRKFTINTTSIGKENSVNFNSLKNELELNIVNLKDDVDVNYLIIMLQEFKDFLENDKNFNRISSILL